MKNSKSKYYRKGRKYKLEEILPLIEKSSWLLGTEKAKRIKLDGDLINIRSSRLWSFRKDHVCACCGLVGSYFVKEKRHSDEYYGLNLYGIDNGLEVMMTHDHIVPLSRGGSKSSKNIQTYCTNCNNLKGNRIINNPDLAWEVYDIEILTSGFFAGGFKNFRDNQLYLPFNHKYRKLNKIIMDRKLDEVLV